MDSSHLCFLEDSFKIVPLTGEHYQRQILIDCLLGASWEPPSMGWVYTTHASPLLLSEHLEYGPGCMVAPCIFGGRKAKILSQQVGDYHQPQHPFFPHRVWPDMWGCWHETWCAGRVEQPLVAHSQVRLSWEPQVTASTWVRNINSGDTTAVRVCWTPQRANK